MTIRMARALVEELLRQGRARYPGPAGGVLLGVPGDAPTVEASRPVSLPDGTPACPAPTADDVRGAERAGAMKGLAVVGTWHTHPDGPAEPSPADLAAARPGLVCLIAAVRQGQAGEWACWTLGPQGGPLEPVIVRLTSG